MARKRRRSRNSRWTRADSYMPRSSYRKRRSWGRRFGRFAAFLFIASAFALAIWLRDDGPPGDGVTIAQHWSECGTRGRGQYCTSDGDTVTIGYGRNARRIRFTGFDAPEIKGQCAAEQAKARDAETALRAWLNQGAFDWDGGATPPRDSYGRELRSAWRTGPDGKIDALAEHMIAAGLAEGDAIWERKNWCG